MERLQAPAAGLQKMQKENGEEMIEKKLGKISKVKFGIGGYQDAMIGVYFTLEGKGWGVGADRSAWDAQMIKHSDSCKWTEEDRDNQYADIIRYLSKLFMDAKVTSINDLKDIPVECTFENNKLKEWRVLTEVM